MYFCLLYKLESSLIFLEKIMVEKYETRFYR